MYNVHFLRTIVISNIPSEKVLIGQVKLQVRIWSSKMLQYEIQLNWISFI